MVEWLSSGNVECIRYHTLDRSVTKNRITGDQSHGKTVCLGACVCCFCFFRCGEYLAIGVTESEARMSMCNRSKKQ